MLLISFAFDPKIILKLFLSAKVAASPENQRNFSNFYRLPTSHKTTQKWKRATNTALTVQKSIR